MGSAKRKSPLIVTQFPGYFDSACFLLYHNPLSATAPPTRKHSPVRGQKPGALPDGPFRRPPQHVDPGHMDDALEGKSSRRCQPGTAQGYRAVLGKFLEWTSAAMPLDRTGNALREQQPPGDDAPVPGIDDHFNILVEEVAVDNRSRTHPTLPWCAASSIIDLCILL
jgi:hypothetical protein